MSGADPPVLALDRATIAYGAQVVVRDLSVAVGAGERLALRGASGSGKSSVLRTMAGLQRVTAGRVVIEGVDVTGRSPAAWQPLRRRIQLMLQEAGASLDPRRPVGASLAEALRAHRLGAPASWPARVAAALAEVSLEADVAARLPHQLSGGQRQRAALARALLVEPRVLLLDEPTAGADVIVRTELLGLLLARAAAREMALVVATHDPAVARALGREVTLGAPSAAG